DLLRPRALGGDEVRDAPREHGGLARARAGHDQQRPVAVQHGLALGVGESFEDAVLGGGDGGGHGSYSVRQTGQRGTIGLAARRPPRAISTTRDDPSSRSAL